MINQGNSVLNLANKWFLRVFFLFWGLFIFLDYANRSSYFIDAIKKFRHFDLLVFLGIVSVVLLFVLFKAKFSLKSVQLKGISGWKLYLASFIFTVTIFSFYGFENNLFRDGFFPAILHFSSLIIGTQLGLFFIVAVAAGIGNLCIKALKINLSKQAQTIISIGVGFSLIGLLIFIMGASQMLNFEAVWPLFLVLGGIAWRQIYSFSQKVLVQSAKPFKLHPLHLVGVFVLIIFIAMNLTGMIRSMPVGFDALNLYMNTPNLIYEYGGLTQGGQAYNWSLIMSLGFVMFDSTAMALLLSALPGILSVFALYILARKYLSEGWSLIVCVLFYVTPVIIWQSVQEAKVDLGLLFILLIVSLLVLDVFQRKEIEKETDSSKSLIWKLFTFQNIDLKTYLLIGWMTGYAFGIKYTTLFLFFGLICLLFYKSNKQAGFWASLLICFALVFGLKLYEFSSISIDFNQIRPILFISLILSIPFVIFSFRQNRWGLLNSLKISILIGFGLFLNFLPWMVKHYNENKELTINALFTGKSPLPELDFTYLGMFLNGESDLSSNTSHLLAENISAVEKKPIEKIEDPNIAIKSSGQNRSELLAQDFDPERYRERQTRPEWKEKGIYEEISRYMGYEAGLVRFTSLPYDLTMKTNVHIYATDIGYALLLILPLFMFVYKGNHLPLNILKALILLIILSSSILSVYMAGRHIELDGIKSLIETEIKPGTEVLVAIYIILLQFILWIGSVFSFVYEAMLKPGILYTYLLVLGICVLLFFLFRHSLSSFSQSLKYLTGLSFIYFIFWFLLASGISWYGILGLALGPLFIVISITEKNFTIGKDIYFRWMSYVFIGIWIFMSGILRMTHTNPIDAPNYHYYMPEFAEYQAGNFTARQAREKLINVYLPALSEINRDKTARVIRVATFINYFIESNDKRVYMDNQLNLLGNLIANTADKKEALERLKGAQIKYLVIALNVGANDITPEKSVQAKANKLMDFLFNNQGLRLVTTDRLVHDPRSNQLVNVNGEQIPVKHDVFGARIVAPGLFAVYEILYDNI